MHIPSVLRIGSVNDSLYIKGNNQATQNGLLLIKNDRTYMPSIWSFDIKAIMVVNRFTNFQFNHIFKSKTIGVIDISQFSI